ncbi:MAG: DUF2855 family protein [Pseudonocardia sp.]
MQPASLLGTDRWDLLVRRDDVSVFSLRPRAELPLEPGTARLAVEALVLTSNNLTYAALGERAGYWTAFPAPPGFGRVPAWGIAVVEASTHGDVAVGDRYFGLLPMSTDLTVRPASTETGSFLDDSAHRSGLDDSYRRYRPAGEPDHLDLLRAVVRTTYPACLQLADHVMDVHADTRPLTVVLSSASSKTAIGTAERLTRAPGIRTHGLTSPVNVAFTAGLDVYDQVSAYDDLDRLAAEGPAVFLDLTRNPDVVTSVHQLLGNRLRRTVLIGGTHSGQPLEVPGLPEPDRFFAPAQQALQRTKIGDLAYEQRLAAAEEQFLRRATDWLRVDERVGPAALQDAFRALVAGPQAPDVATVVRPRPGPVSRDAARN